MGLEWKSASNTAGCGLGAGKSSGPNPAFRDAHGSPGLSPLPSSAVSTHSLCCESAGQCTNKSNCESAGRGCELWVADAHMLLQPLDETLASPLLTVTTPSKKIKCLPTFTGIFHVYPASGRTLILQKLDKDSRGSSFSLCLPISLE